MKKDVGYFPHYLNARHDRKLVRLRMAMGPEGYGIFFMLLEVLREQTDFKYPLADLDILAHEFGTSKEKVGTVVAAYGLFEVDEHDNFFSPRLLDNLEPMFQLREMRSQAGKKGAETRWQTDGKAIAKPYSKDGKAIAKPYSKDGKAIAKPYGKDGKTDLPYSNANGKRDGKIAKESRVDKSKEKESRENAPSLQDFINYFQMKGYSKEAAANAHQWCEENDWTRRNGGRILPDWQPFVQKWFEPKHKETSTDQYHKNFYKNIHG